MQTESAEGTQAEVSAAHNQSRRLALCLVILSLTFLMASCVFFLRSLSWLSTRMLRAARSAGASCASKLRAAFSRRVGRGAERSKAFARLSAPLVDFCAARRALCAANEEPFCSAFAFAVPFAGLAEAAAEAAARGNAARASARLALEDGPAAAAEEEEDAEDAAAAAAACRLFFACCCILSLCSAACCCRCCLERLSMGTEGRDRRVARAEERRMSGGCLLSATSVMRGRS